MTLATPPALPFLVVLDADSTTIKDEVIELLADVAGTRAEVSLVTERAMRGELDFAESLRERVATLSGLPDSCFNDVYARIRPSDGVHDLIAAIHEYGGAVGVVSGGFHELLDLLASDLELDFWRANRLEVFDGVLTGRVTGPIIDARAKAETLRGWATTSGIPLSRTVAIGDGANDLEMMAVAGLSIAYNAKPVVRERANVVLDTPDLSLVIPYIHTLVAP
ncbi:phosphoserine phosphatase SerB [Klugiella xanthotipulae]|uniref:phosphoserine phosphatase n=1 Tax=Klugiella xanthotipulae TaxID=244735 RepID=A0A543HSV7_9MICO|nr:phosphoserine phosphatase SerB [Klugiella xanthotipulae]TQM61369.1 phosphoserine phosphatase [Klugiella xanthotipulae]